MLAKVRTSLGSILSLAQRQGLVGRNVVRERSREKKRNGADKRKRGKAKLAVGVDIPTPVEIKAMLDHAKPAWKALLATAAGTGLTRIRASRTTLV